MSTIEALEQAVTPTELVYSGKLARAARWRERYLQEGNKTRFDKCDALYRRRLAQLTGIDTKYRETVALYEQLRIRQSPIRTIEPVVVTHNQNGAVVTNETAVKDLAIVHGVNGTIVNGLEGGSHPVQSELETVDPPIDPLAKYRESIKEEPDWTIQSRPLTQKLKNRRFPDGKYPDGVIPSRVVLARLAYDTSLQPVYKTEREAAKAAFAEAIANGRPAPHAPQRDRTVAVFFKDYYPRNQAKLAKLAPEIQESIKRIKGDPILRVLGSRRLLRLANYEITLEEALLERETGIKGGLESVEITNGAAAGIGNGRLARGRGNGTELIKRPGVVRLRSGEVETIRVFGEVLAKHGWHENTLRTVALTLYKDEIPEIGVEGREAVIGKKLNAVMRDRSHIKLTMEKVAQVRAEGGRVDPSIIQSCTRIAEQLGIPSISTSNLVDLLYKRTTPDALRSAQVVVQPVGSSRGVGEVSRNTENVRPGEISEQDAGLFLTLIQLNDEQTGRRFESFEEAVMDLAHDYLESIVDPAQRVVQFEELVEKTSRTAASIMEKIEWGKGASRIPGEVPENLSKLIEDMHEIRSVTGRRIYADLPSSTLRKVVLFQQSDPRFYQ